MHLKVQTQDNQILRSVNKISNKEDPLTEVGVCAPSWLKYVE
jgi:hypothetical protein